MTTVILTSQEVDAAWNWLTTNLPPRNPSPQLPFEFDDLSNWQNQSGRLLHSGHVPLEKCGHLYLTTQLGALTEVTDFLNGGQPQNVFITTPKLDQDVRKVINSKPRFRNALSEHLSFWIRMGHAKHQNIGQFAHSKPNFHPEDKGSDGVFAINGQAFLVEAMSVKNSIHNPKKEVSSTSFRKGHAPKPRKMLDEFHTNKTTGDGIQRVYDKLHEIGSLLNFDTNNWLRAGLNTQISCHGVTVSDYGHSSPDTFEAFDRVGHSRNERMATYIGADDWSNFAENCRDFLVTLLQGKQVW